MEPVPIHIVREDGGIERVGEWRAPRLVLERAGEFSWAIGNNDAHLGNYGLTFDERGRASLAPAFDVLPMALAPRFDELPDAHLWPREAAIPEHVRPLVEDLARRMDADAAISAGFKTLWRRYVGL